MLEHVVKLAFDDFLERVPGLFQAVVGEAVLREVVGLDFLCSHAFSYSLRAAVREGSQALVLFRLPKFGAKQVEGNFFVSGLVAFFAHKNDNAGGFVGEADSGVDLIDVLTSGAAGTSKLPFEVGFFNFD